MRKYLSIIGICSLLVLIGASCTKTTYKTSGPGGMWVTADRGDSWQSISVMPTLDGNQSLSKVSAYKLFLDPQDPNALYWSSRTNGLFYSYDAGKSWKRSGAPFNQGFVYSIAVHPKHKCTIYATNGRQIFKTQDCMRSWEQMFQEVRSDESIRSLAFDPFGENIIYMGERSGQLYKSDDQGKSWQRHGNVGSKLSEIKFDLVRPQVMYVATLSNGLYRSNDDGKTWENLMESLDSFPGSSKFRRLVVYPTKPNHIYWISTYGILVSKNAGDDWLAFKLVTPPGSVSIYGFAVDPNNEKRMYYAATHKGRSTFYRTEDGGLSWVTRRMPSQQIPTVMHVHPNNNDWIYLGYTIPPNK